MAKASKFNENTKSNDWCFTINNYEIKDIDRLKTIQCDYIVVNKEVGKSGTPHLQGFIQMKSSSRMSTMKKLIGEKSHLEPRQGTPEQAANYCKKEPGYIEQGTLKNATVKKGSRSDLKTVAENIMKGQTINQLAEENPEMVVKYDRGLSFLSGIQQEKEARKWRTVKVYTLYGISQSGKSRYMSDNHPTEDCYKVRKGNSGIWWTGYHGQPIIQINDFYGNMDYSELLNLLDGHSLQLDTKHGHTWARWTTVYITSNTHPVDWYPRLANKDGKMPLALLNRLNSGGICYLNKKWDDNNKPVYKFHQFDIIEEEIKSETPDPILEKLEQDVLAKATTSEDYDIFLTGREKESYTLKLRVNTVTPINVSGPSSNGPITGPLTKLNPSSFKLNNCDTKNYEFILDESSSHSSGGKSDSIPWNCTIQPPDNCPEVSSDNLEYIHSVEPAENPFEHSLNLLSTGCVGNTRENFAATQLETEDKSSENNDLSVNTDEIPTGDVIPEEDFSRVLTIVNEWMQENPLKRPDDPAILEYLRKWSVLDQYNIMMEQAHKEMLEEENNIALASNSWLPPSNEGKTFPKMPTVRRRRIIRRT